MLKYLALLIVARCLGWLPTRPAYAIARVVADLAYLVYRKGRRNGEDNVRHVIGPDASRSEVTRATRHIFRNVFRYYADMVRLPHMDIERLYEEKLTFHGLEHLQKALAAGRGVIISSAHYGNPELAVQAMKVLGVTVLAFVEPLKPQRYADLMQKLRSSHGLIYRPISLSSIKEALRHLRQGGVVVLLSDRDISKTGITLPFFGAETSVPTGAIELALHTGAQIIPAFSRRRQLDECDVYIEPPLQLTCTGDDKEDLRVNTLALLSRIEEYVREDPGQWMVLERIWPDRESAPQSEPNSSPAGVARS
jgi:lauroyl/myristoyl acyltransferase